MAKIKSKEVTLDTIEKEDILEMAKYIQQLEQLTKDQRGYIIQLQQQLTNVGKRIQQARTQAQHPQGTEITLVQDVKLELE